MTMTTISGGGRQVTVTLVIRWQSR
jgi:hypothetical protein